VNERERVLALVQRYGWNSTAFQTLEPGYSYFFHGDDSCVAYVATRRAWVVAGAPIAAPDAIAEVTRAFVAAARAAGKRCCFVATEDRLREASAGALRSVRIGEQPVWIPRNWPDTLRAHKSLREQLRRARAKGVRIREVTPAELEAGPVRDAIRAVADRWLATRDMAPMDFLLRVDPFTFPAHRRCFVAELDGRVVGFAAAIPVPARQGWFLEDLVREPDAPNGTAESLVDAVLQWAAREGCEWLTLGTSPLAGEMRGVLRLARRGSGFLYDFEGLHAFKAKLRPDHWSPIHVSYPETQGMLVSLADVLAAFAGGGLLRFAARSLWRGPDAVIRAFAWLLVPWTMLLAIAPAEHWFGGAAPKWFWVAFDVVLATGLFRLLRRPSAQLARALAIAATVDAVLTLAHASVWTFGRADDPLQRFVVVIACLAPALAATVLWGATRTRMRALRDARVSARVTPP